jgi:hypothetical protein
MRAMSIARTAATKRMTIVTAISGSMAPARAERLVCRNENEEFESVLLKSFFMVWSCVEQLATTMPYANGWPNQRICWPNAETPDKRGYFSDEIVFNGLELPGRCFEMET